MKTSALITGLAGAAVVASTWAAIATAHALPASLPRHLLLYLAAGSAWLVAAFVIVRLPQSRAQLAVIVAVAIALRLPAWLAQPAHSDDFHRYLWDGKVQRAGINPYRFAPDAAALAPLRDAGWAGVNNRSLPTIYPPLAEAAFAAAPSLGAWKLIVALGDAAIALLLYIGLADRRRVVLWAWSPLVVMELGLNAHVDALGVALLVGALVAWQRGRAAAAGALVAAAAAVKLLPIVALAGMRRRSAVVAAALVAIALALPYATAGPRMAGSLGEYSRRWRVNDGAFALLHAGAERLVAHTRFAGRYDLSGSPRVARLVTGRDRDTLFADEVAGFIARIAAGVIFVAVVASALWRRLPPARVAEAGIGAFVLLTPALHPWYVVWLLPLVAVGGSWAWLVLALLAPLGYRPLDVWLAGGPWRDPVWTRLLEHGLTLVALAIDRWQPSGIIVKFGETDPRRWRWSQGG